MNSSPLHLQRRAWLLVFALSILPFLLRIHLDLDAVQRQAVLALYRDWRWSSPLYSIHTGSPIIFERQRERDVFEEFFKVQLQQDFKVVDVGDYPRVRAFFAPGASLEARIETQLPSQRAVKDWTAWSGGVRLVNNGILLGIWVGLLLWVLGRSLSASALMSIFVIFLWRADWNLLAMPGQIGNIGFNFIRELVLRFRYHDWTASELGRVPELGALLWFLVAGMASYILRLKNLTWRFYATALLSIALEPLSIYTGSLFGHWGTDARWWKIYTLSFAFRFVSLSQILLATLRGRSTAVEEKSASSMAESALPASLHFLPLAFVASGGWAWLSCTLNGTAGDSLLRLKVFAMGLILSVVMGSRIFSLWLGILVLAVMLPPTRGHLASAAWYGLMLDGLALGWWVSPFKGVIPFKSWAQDGWRFSIVTLLAWVIGVFLSSVGAPLLIVWVTLVLSMWAFAQLSQAQDSAALQLEP